MDKQFRNHSNHRRATIHSKKPMKNSSNEKVNIVIQIRGDPKNETLRVRIPANTSLGQIKKFLKQKYGEESNYLYLTHLRPDEASKSSKQSTSNSGKTSVSFTKNSTQQKEKVNIVFKSALGKEEEELRSKVPKNIKIQALKDALAKKFNLIPEDFELVHVKQSK